MSRWRLVLRSLSWFRALNAGVVLGVAIGAAVLTGALVVGDSVRISLREQALLRIGKIDHALVGGERLFRAALADELAEALGGADAAPVLQLRGIASAGGGSRRALDVRVLGIDERFLALAPKLAPYPPPGKGEVFLNRRLAEQLGAQPGDTVVLRVESPSRMHREAVLSSSAESVQAISLLFARILEDPDFGRFDLTAGQLPPKNAYLSLAALQERLGFGSRANLCLVGGPERPSADRLSAERVRAAVEERWTLADGGLDTRILEGSGDVELDAERITFDPAVVSALRGLPRPALGVYTYLVNELRVGERSTPYSLVSALGRLTDPAIEGASPAGFDFLPAGLKGDGIVINSWLADDLQAKPGDQLELRYFGLGETGELDTLAEESRSFTVHSVIAISGLAADRELMPPYPGIEGSDSCLDWELDLPLDMSRVREKDEAWWNDHGGTPKAFVTLAAGEELWGSPRFGSLTAVRFAGSEAEAALAALRDELDPRALGLAFRDVRAPAGEAVLLSAIGSVIGMALAAGYAEAVIGGLGSIWEDAVAHAAIRPHVRFPVLLLGGACTLIVATLSAWLTLRRQAERPAVDLLGVSAGVGAGDASTALHGFRRSKLLALFSLVGMAGAMAWCHLASGPAKPAASFLAGTLALIAVLTTCRLILVGRRGGTAATFRGISGLAWSNAARRPARSLATIILFACGVFLVIVVGVNQKGPPADPSVRSSGTGGFLLLGRSSLAIVPERRAAERGTGFKLSPSQPANVSVVPLRVRDGDDASCLNLNRPQEPRLLGVDPIELAEREAFSFAGVLSDEGTNPWLLLAGGGEHEPIPAITDQASATWSLHRGLGDTIDYVDEQGRPFQVKLVATIAGSILQGDLIIDEARFRGRYPSETGFRLFLVDAPAEGTAELAATWMRELSDVGLEVESTSRRLTLLGAVQNTYLMIFQVLGGLGLLLGSAGIGVIVLRNIAERRSELAVLSAIGFRSASVQRLLLVEHAWILLAGTASGTFGALAAILPLSGGAGAGFPILPMVGLLSGVLLGGFLWVWLATRLAWRGPSLEILSRSR